MHLSGEHNNQLTKLTEKQSRLIVLRLTKPDLLTRMQERIEHKHAFDDLTDQENPDCETFAYFRIFINSDKDAVRYTY
jgi:hypothetical protein